MGKVRMHGRAPADHPIYSSGVTITFGGFRLPPMRYNGEPGATGFWLHGFEVWEVERSHIRTVMNNPERFGRKPGEVEERHALYGEKLGAEGAARREIICEVCEAGWIRIRNHTGKEGYWCVTLHDEPRRRFHVKRFLRFAQGKLGLAPDADLRIEDLAAGTDCWYRFADGGVAAYLNGGKPSST